jgi:A/G-specific adenine glycosylase
MNAAFREALVSWYRRNARDLPWRPSRTSGRQALERRRKPTPYRVWVSEVMLQQTRVEAVRDYFTRFMTRFPTIRKLAAADEEEVLEAWSGLGYYRRARMLHAAARQILAEHNGRFPSQRDQVLALPGVGRYTAGAILSIAFNQPEPIVDGNIERVFARLAARNGAGKAAWQFAETHVGEGAAEGLHASDLNQALMELGATVCTPRGPRCELCPVQSHCRAFSTGAVDQYPRRKSATAPRRKRYLFAALHDDRGRILLVRRTRNESASLLPGGLWELPHRDWTGPKAATLDALAEQLALKFDADGPASRRSHSIMNYRLELTVQPCRVGGDVPTAQDRRWFTRAGAQRAAIASATRKLLDAMWNA